MKCAGGESRSGMGGQPQESMWPAAIDARPGTNKMLDAGKTMTMTNALALHVSSELLRTRVDELT